jgi:tRNA modification GTPase
LRAGNTVVVWNKMDLAPAGAVLPEWRDFGQVAVSALDGSRIGELEEKITQLIDGKKDMIDGDLIAVNARQAADLAEAGVCLQAAEAKLRGQAPDELMASDLRGALDALGRIGGPVDHEQILDKLFSTFCVGK